MTVIWISQTSDTPIRPKDIDTDDSLAGTFSERDMEMSAFWIVRFCQTQRSWAPFSLEDLNRYILVNDSWIKDGLPDEDGLRGLISHGLIQLRDGVLTLTTAFVATCYKTSPVQGLPRKKSVRKPRKTNRVSRYQQIKEDPFSP